MPHNSSKLVLDIALACSEIQTFTQGITFQDYQKDRMLQLAIEREFEIIGEAMSRLARLEPETIEQRYPEYRRIIGLRNILAHGYDVVDDRILWDLAINKVPELKAQSA